LFVIQTGWSKRLSIQLVTSPGSNSGPRRRPRRHRHPPSAARLLGYLRRLWSKSSRTGWVHFELQKFADFSGLSVRQVQRAKNHLQVTGVVLFVTISNSTGSRGHRVYAGDPVTLEGTSKTLMGWTVLGRPRHRWDKIRGYLHPLPRSKSSEKPENPALGCTREPTDILNVPHTRGKSLQHWNDFTFQVNELKSGLLGRGESPPGLTWNPLREANGEERGLAWFVTRKISKCWWDNCKVRHPGQKLGGIYNLVLRWIRRGVNISDILSNFQISLEKMHGLCVDFQLMRGEPDLRFTVGSTITLTDRRLCRLYSSNQLVHWSDCVVQT
jgi:hypothetical protein